MVCTSALNFAILGSWITKDTWIGSKSYTDPLTGVIGWEWQTTTDKPYSNWALDEPNSTGDCVRLKFASSLQWADWKCTVSYPSLCELVLVV